MCKYKSVNIVYLLVLGETKATAQDKFLPFLNLEYRSSPTAPLWEGEKKADIQEENDRINASCRPVMPMLMDSVSYKLVWTEFSA